MIGRTLGNYEITGELGKGGMGEVYRARDVRLEREVAIKVLPEEIAGDRDIQSRFRREAQTISGLNHPHICVLHDVGEQDGVHFLVMELVEGITLTQTLQKGPLPIADVLRYGAQVADALDRAHRAGVIHRDLKPGNVMITKAGAKLMDFGLARVARPRVAQDATVALGDEALTAEGAIVGTYQYMAPEQLEGKEVDQRSDLWALGCVLHEMATGQRAFEGATQASLIGSILHSEPAPVSERVELSPPDFDRLVSACLAKDPEDRVQSAHDVKLQLRWLGEGSGSSVVAPAIPAGRRAPRWPLVAALALILGASAAWFAKPGKPSGTALPQRYELGRWPLTGSATPIISPDGQSIVFSVEIDTDRMIYRRDLDELEPVPIPGTEGGTGPFFSPDGRWLGFITRNSVEKVPAGGGVPQRIATISGINAADWSEDGIIYLGPQAGGVTGDVALYAVPAAGGDPTIFGRVQGSEANVWLPEVLPGGKTVIATVLGEGSNLVAFHQDGSRETLLVDVFEGRYVEPGYLFYRDDENEAVMAVRFDAEGVRVTGEPVAVSEPIDGAFCFDVSSNGMLVYVPELGEGDRAELRYVYRDGTSKRISNVQSSWSQPRISPDGTKVVVRETGTNCQLWMHDLVRGSFVRIARDGDCHDPVWSPDSRHVLFNRVDLGEIVTVGATGTSAVEVVASGANRGVPGSWIGPGNFMVYTVTGTDGQPDIWVRHMDTGETESFLATPQAENQPELSPDGTLIAYSTEDVGLAEVYVRSYPADGSVWQVSVGGGHSPVWSHDGTELYFVRSQDGVLMRSEAKRGAELEFGIPTEIHEDLLSPSRRRDYDVAEDGSFVVVVGNASTPEKRLRVVLNWPGLVAELVGTSR